MSPNIPSFNALWFKSCSQTMFPLMKVLMQWRNSFFDGFDAHPRIAMELDSSELLKRLICAELGMGFLPRANVLDDAHAGLLKILKVEGMRLQRDLALIYRKDRTLTHAAQAFLEIATSASGQTAYAPMKIAKTAKG